MTVEVARWFDGKLARLERQNAPGVWAKDERHALTLDERRYLGGRQDALRDAMAPADAETIRTAVARFILRWPNFPKDDLEARKRTYERELARFPLWAIVEGMQASGGEHAPASPVLGEACEAALRKAEDESVKIGRLLAAQTFHTPTPEERERVGAQFQELADDMKARMDVSHEPELQRDRYRYTNADYERMAEEMARNPVTLPQFSPALRDSLAKRGAA